MAGQRTEKTKHAGIYRVHRRGCQGGRCKCPERYQATVYDPQTDKLVRKHFDGLRQAKVWRTELMNAAN